MKSRVLSDAKPTVRRSSKEQRVENEASRAYRFTLTLSQVNFEDPSDQYEKQYSYKFGCRSPDEAFKKAVQLLDSLKESL